MTAEAMADRDRMVIGLVDSAREVGTAPIEDEDLAPMGQGQEGLTVAGMIGMVAVEVRVRISQEVIACTNRGSLDLHMGNEEEASMEVRQG